MEKYKIPVYLKVLAVLLLIIVIIFVLTIGRSLLIPLFLGGYIAMLMNPFCDWMESKKIPRILSGVISLLCALVFIMGILSVVILQVRDFSKDFDDVTSRLDNYLSDVDILATDLLGADLGLKDGIDKSQIFNLLESNSDTVSNFLMHTIGSLASVILIPVFIFLMLIYRDHLSEFIARLFRQHNDDDVKEKISSLRKIVQYYILGVLKVMGILAVVNTAVLYLIGVKHALFFGFFAALLNIIPYLGPFLGAILPFIFAFLTMDSLFYPFMVVVSFTLIQMVESYYLTPTIVGNNVNLNALITIVGLLIGGAIWGVVGMILIIPTLAIMKRIFDLQESTKPFSFLFGGEQELKKQDGKLKPWE